MKNLWAYTESNGGPFPPLQSDKQLQFGCLSARFTWHFDPLQRVFSPPVLMIWCSSILLSLLQHCTCDQYGRRKRGIPFPLQQQGALIWLPEKDLALRVDICNIRLTKQSRNIYISWKWVKVQKQAKMCHNG